MLATFYIALIVSVLLLTTAFVLPRRLKSSKKAFITAIVVAILACLPLALTAYIGYFLATAKYLNSIETEIEGIHYSRLVEVLDNTQAVLHIAEIPLRDYCLDVDYRSGDDRSAPFIADTTSARLQQSEAVLASNASFFSPFKDKHLFNYYPHKGDGVRLVGYALLRGKRYGKPLQNWPLVIVDKQCGLTFSASFNETQVAQTRFVVSAKSWLLKDGDVLAEPEGRRYPRLALGLSKNRETLFLVAVDGKQPRYSMGLDLDELAVRLLSFGVDTAVELDGGGSVTMVARLNGRIEMLNRPIHTKIPGRERPVANHLLITPKKEELIHDG